MNSAAIGVEEGKSESPIPEEPEPILEVVNLTKVFPNGRTVLNGITFKVYPEETFVILGGSGCGKSTLLNILIGVLEPTSGEVRIFGQDLHRLQQRLKARDIQEFSIAYFGTALLHKAGLPHYELLSPTEPSRGYVAVSLHHLTIDYKKNSSFAWLKSYTPVERIGKSIDLFYIGP